MIRMSSTASGLARAAVSGAARLPQPLQQPPQPQQQQQQRPGKRPASESPRRRSSGGVSKPPSLKAARRERDSDSDDGDAVPRRQRPKQIPEASVRDALAASIPGSATEVPCSSGFVDIVTPDELIEVKRAQLWKGGLGQVLVYSKDFPGLAPRLHLFGQKSYEHFALAHATCRMFGVAVTTDAGDAPPVASSQSQPPGARAAFVRPSPGPPPERRLCAGGLLRSLLDRLGRSRAS